MIELLKQWAEDVSKAYDVLAFAQTERALEMLAKTRTSLRQAIAELESQEPVAWMDADGNVSDNNDHKCFPIPLYTHPPQRTWVGLTEDEMFELWLSADEQKDRMAFGKAVEAKLKELNT
jgi:hypothetical protein